MTPQIMKQRLEYIKNPDIKEEVVKKHMILVLDALVNWVIEHDR